MNSGVVIAGRFFVAFFGNTKFQRWGLFLWSRAWLRTMIWMVTVRSSPPFPPSPSCRLHTAQRAIKQTQVTVQKIGKEIEEKLRTTATCTERVSALARQPHFSNSFDYFQLKSKNILR